MRMVVWMPGMLVIGLLLLIGCRPELTGDAKTAQGVILERGYKVTAYKGVVHSYTLDRNLLFGSTESIPYQQVWGVQSVKLELFFGKNITVYGFTSPIIRLQASRRPTPTYMS